VKPDGSGTHEQVAELHNPNDLEKALRETFNRDSVKDVIRSLVAQSREFDDD
jgi:hypothetical protein